MGFLLPSRSSNSENDDEKPTRTLVSILKRQSSSSKSTHSNREEKDTTTEVKEEENAATQVKSKPSRKTENKTSVKDGEVKAKRADTKKTRDEERETSVIPVLHLSRLSVLHTYLSVRQASKSYLLFSSTQTNTVTRTSSFGPGRMEKHITYNSVDVPVYLPQQHGTITKDENTNSDATVAISVGLYLSDNAERDRCVGTGLVSVPQSKTSGRVAVNVDLKGRAGETVGVLSSNGVLSGSYNAKNAIGQFINMFPVNSRKLKPRSRTRLQVEVLLILLAPFIVLGAMVSSAYVASSKAELVHCTQISLAFGVTLVVLSQPLWTGWCGALVSRVLELNVTKCCARVNVCEASVSCWISLERACHMTIQAKQVQVKNPYGFPMSNVMLRCGNVHCELSLSIVAFLRVLFRRRKHMPLKFHKENTSFGVVRVEKLEIEQLEMNAESWDGRLNLSTLHKDILDYSVLQSLTNRKVQKRLGMKSLKSIPNLLQLKVLKCSNLGGSTLNVAGELSSGVSNHLTETDSDLFEKMSTMSATSTRSAPHASIRGAHSNSEGIKSTMLEHKPFVVVTLRKMQGRTRSRPGTLNPEWENELLSFAANDPTTLVHVRVYNKVDSKLYGQWVTTIGSLVCNPNGCKPLLPYVYDEPSVECTSKVPDNAAPPLLGNSKSSLSRSSSASHKMAPESKHSKTPNAEKSSSTYPTSVSNQDNAAAVKHKPPHASLGTLNKDSNVHKEDGLKGTWVTGTFPLMSKNWKRQSGTIQLQFRWCFASQSALERVKNLHQRMQKRVPTVNSQAKQLMQEWLLLGSSLGAPYTCVKYAFLYDIRRVTVRDVRMYVRDMVPSHRNDVDELRCRGLEVGIADAVKIDRAEWTTEFQPRSSSNELGITKPQFLHHMLKAITIRGAFGAIPRENAWSKHQFSPSFFVRLGELLSISQSGPPLSLPSWTSASQAGSPYSQTSIPFVSRFKATSEESTWGDKGIPDLNRTRSFQHDNRYHYTKQHTSSRIDSTGSTKKVLINPIPQTINNKVRTVIDHSASADYDGFHGNGWSVDDRQLRYRSSRAKRERKSKPPTTAV